MKNKVYGLKSMVILPTGEIERDGTLLFPNKEKADKFLAFVSHMANNTKQQHQMRGTKSSHYEHDQEYVVTNSLAEFVHTKTHFFVSRIGIHLLENQQNYVAENDVAIFNFINTDDESDTDADNNVIDVDATSVDDKKE